MRNDQPRAAVSPGVLLEHTDGLITAVQRYHSALAQMLAAEHTIREVVDNALLAGVSPTALRGIINSFAEAQSTPLLFAADVDARLAEDVHETVDGPPSDLVARRRKGITSA